MPVEPSTLTQLLRGRFIVFDGPDGAGKTMQRDRLAEALRAAGSDVLTCRDPGGTTIGDRIRGVLLNHDLSTMNVNCETLLFMASRAQLVSEIVKPALEEGSTVLCDRFISSTCAYQGAAGYDPKRIIELAEFAIDGCWPDLTVVLDIDTEEGFSRIGRRPHHAGKNRQRSSGEGTLFEGSRPDAMEARSLDFHRQVRQIFLELDQHYPRPVRIVKAGDDPAAVHQRILQVFSDVFA